MGELTPMSSTDKTKAGVRAIGGIGGAIAIGVITSLANALWGIPGIVLGGISAILGISSIRSDSKTDKVGGWIALGAGLLVGLPALTQVPVIGTLLMPLAGISSFVMGAGAVLLLGYGVFNAVKFIRGMKESR
jgi:hypothetical protein